MMVYKVSVGSVDGVTDHQLITNDPREAEKFLKAHDHEGSSIDLGIYTDNPEEVYALLDAAPDKPRD